MKYLSVILGAMVWFTSLCPCQALKPDLVFTPTTGTQITPDEHRTYIQTRCIVKNTGKGVFSPTAGSTAHFFELVTLNLDTRESWTGYKDFFYSTISPGDSDEYNENYGTPGTGKHYIAKVTVNAAHPRAFPFTPNVFYFGFYVSDTAFSGVPTFYGMPESWLVTPENMRAVDRVK